MSLKQVQGVGAMDMYKQNAVFYMFENQNVILTLVQKKIIEYNFSHMFFGTWLSQYNQVKKLPKLVEWYGISFIAS